MTERTPESVYYKGFEIVPKPDETPEGGWKSKVIIWLHINEGSISIPVSTDQISTNKNEANMSSLSLGRSWIDNEVKEIEYRNHNILFFPSRVPKEWKAHVLIYKVEHGSKEFMRHINPKDHPDEFEQKEDALQYYVSLGKDWIDQIVRTEHG